MKNFENVIVPSKSYKQKTCCRLVGYVTDENSLIRIRKIKRYTL